MTDTIYALATAPGRAGVAIVRLSGPDAALALRDLTGALPPPRQAQYAHFRDPQSCEILDDGIALYFAAPASMTGEDVAELQLHGSRAVLAAVFAVLARRSGCRLAEPGEFTKRAFLNGKLDLTTAEAIADLVEAETSAQRRQAMRQLQGEFGRRCEAWRTRLIGAQARLEAEIDFPEEGLPAAQWAAARQETMTLRQEIAAELADNRRGERLREGVAVAILGPPNAGKSSLMNALARREVAITSHIAGTTRDVIEVALDLGGYPVVLADTAGLRDSADSIEEEGIRRARARAASADLKLVVLDATKPGEANALRDLIDARTIVVVNKIDLMPETPAAQADLARAGSLGTGGALYCSATSGEGIAALIARLSEAVEAALGAETAPLVTRARHREALENCVAALDRFAEAEMPELAAEDLRKAARSLGRITGRVDVEDMLDALFREFCIGK
ncbi:MAG TPA: tRNA uridine-5-carboxymethylaminomethyl(34) synthesis GTPase MnmE [Stellaceae bacterium]|jgi:tRNA modification GTPase|nr:tRNA uridine-5-carboxymethylaminomethyl(34) synthesis GTPase MnmE [Stellaceae bacterium]